MPNKQRRKCRTHNANLIPLFRDTRHMHDFPFWKCPRCAYVDYSDIASSMLATAHNVMREYDEACAVYLREGQHV